MTKKSFILCLSMTTAMLLSASCASILNGSRAKVTVRNDDVTVPVTLSYDNKVERQIFLPYDIKIKRGFKATTITAEADGYGEGKAVVRKKFNPTTLCNIILGGLPGMGIDAATGAFMKPESKDIFIPFKPVENDKTEVAVETVKVPMALPPAENTERVTRENPGSTSLESTVIRWYFDSEPKGARIFWRVISSIPNEVSNTNELWLGNTPYEGTRSFNITGLTKENARDVQIEIKVKRNGYLDQTKRFNVRQAVDQQEISCFFDMVRE